jgi:peptidoglycan/LPS O-acetylase OafA/YrhL
LIFWICQNQPKKVLILGIIGGIFSKIIAFYFLVINDKSTYIILLQNNFLCSYLSQLCIGIYWGFIYAEHQRFRKIDFIVATSIFSIGFVIYAVLGFTKINIIYMLGFDMLFTPFFFLGMQSLLNRLEQSAKFDLFLGCLSILGIYSYQIYLIHQPLYFVLLPIINRNIQINDYLKIVVTFMMIILILTSYVFLFTKLEQLVIKNLGGVMTKQN